MLHAAVARLNPLFGVGHERLGDLASHPLVELRRQWLPLRWTYPLWYRGLPPHPEWSVGRPDVYHGTNFQAPPLRNRRTVVTVHDLAPLTLPDAVPPAIRAGFERMVRRGLTADVLVTPSRSTADDLVRVLDVPPERIRVIPLGVDPERWAHARPEPSATPYLLHLGTTQPRKNLPRLVRAFARVEGDVELRLVGDQGFGEDALRAAIDAAGDPRIRRIDYVAADRLPALVAGALGVVQPALCEGFCLPLLEAMAAGTPVLTADRSATAEVAGDAALLVDPEDEDALTAALRRLLNDPELRDDLVARGRERAGAFPWSRTAAAHLDLWRELAVH